VSPIRGGKIRKLRRQRGWTQKQLAAKAGLSHAQVSNVERGDRGASVEALERIARALGIKAGDLLR